MKRFFQKLNINFKNTHIPALDGIRGLAIIAVMLYHYFTLYAGWFGVDLFFVLSGFLITGILLDTKANKHYFKNYIVRRMLRILPLYYILLIGFFIVVPLLVNKSSLAPFSIYYKNQAYFWVYLQNWFLLLKEHDLKGSSRMFLHLWSLAIEEQFYIIWPFLVLLFNTKNLIRIIFVLISLSIALKCYYFFSGDSWQYIYFNTFTRLDVLCIGALIAITIRTNSIIPVLEKIVPYIFKILLIVLVGAILIVRPTAPKSQFLEPFGTTFFAIFSAALILYCLSDHKNNRVKKILELKIFRFFGKYSYSMYIFHVLILVLIRPPLFVFLHEHMASNIAFVADNLVCFALIILISQITWFLIEKPALKLKRFFKYEINKTDSLMLHTVVIPQSSTIDNDIKK